MGISSQDHSYMQEALALAQAAEREDEVPVGAIVVDAQGLIVGWGRNQNRQLQDPTAHAEILAVRQACQTIGNYRLNACTLFVTLEPCAMCASAIALARISRIVFAARDFKMGACGSVHNLVNLHAHQPAKIILDEGLCREEAVALLKRFFASRR